MKFSYPRPQKAALTAALVKNIALLLMIAGFSMQTNAQTVSQELSFKNGVLSTGTAGADGAVYRFPSVMKNIDALVKISGRSSSQVKLVTMDLSTTGFDKSFQPQVTYGDNNTSPAGNTDWWMEFQISFVLSNTTTLASITSFNVTGLDIDGNNDKISEYQSFYGLSTYTLEKKSVLTVSNIVETVAGKATTVGKRFDGPVTTFTDVDTSATTAMTTNTYVNTSSFRLRAGAKSTGVSGAADRMYSLWFKSFAYQTAITNALPVTIIDWTATYNNGVTALKWTTTQEINASHFLVERSFDGVDYTDAAMLFAVGNGNGNTTYTYNDKVPADNSGIIYYRLKSVDMDQNYTLSAVKVVRVGQSADGAKIIVYPNPVLNDLRVTVPQVWQGKQLSYQLTNMYGQVIKTFTVESASQTEVINMSQVPAGLYVMKVNAGNETAAQTVIKSAK